MAEKKKRYLLAAGEIAPLAPGLGGCIASDRITVDGAPVGYMYRAAPEVAEDSGWRFLAGDEDDAYMEDDAKHAVHDVNTIANYDRDIIPHLAAKIGSAFERDEDGDLVRVEGGD